MQDNEIDDIVKENVPRLHSYVRRRVRNMDDAEDIVQDALYQLLHTIRVLDNPISHVSSWLYTVAHNLIINHGKKHREDEMPQYGGDDSFMSDISDIMMADDGNTPDIQLLRTMVWEEWGKALAELPLVQRNALVMTEIQGMSVKEASAKMGVSQNTFLSRKHLAVKHIRKRLKALYEELTKR